MNTFIAIIRCVGFWISLILMMALCFFPGYYYGSIWGMVGTMVSPLPIFIAFVIDDAIIWFRRKRKVRLAKLTVAPIIEPKTVIMMIGGDPYRSMPFTVVSQITRKKDTWWMMWVFIPTLFVVYLLVLTVVSWRL